jgi:quercetin dioxygenase-like cupin family protein
MQIGIVGKFEGGWEEAVERADPEQYWVVLAGHSPGSEEPHEHEVAQTIYMLRGTLRFIPFHGDVVEVKEGHIAHVPAGCAHRVEIPEKTLYLMQLERPTDLRKF